MEYKFYKCAKCGKIIVSVNKKPCPTMCCGQPMEEMIPMGENEKHVPSFVREGNKVKVSVNHPMEEGHQIEWFALRSKKGFQMKEPKSPEEARCGFLICDCDEVEEVMAYCNVHGLYGRKA